MKNITPNKAPTKKNRKKIITPDDIDSLFTNDGSKKDDVKEENNGNIVSALFNKDRDNDETNSGDDNYETERNAANSDRDSNVNSVNAIGNINLMSNAASSNINSMANADSSMFNPMLDNNEDVPQWLVDANAEGKRRRAGIKPPKEKAITDDWRFWAGMIAVAGFGSALFSVYQQGAFDLGSYDVEAPLNPNYSSFFRLGLSDKKAKAEL